MNRDVLSVVGNYIKKTQNEFRRLVHVVIKNMTDKQQGNNPHHALTFYHSLQRFNIISHA